MEDNYCVSIFYKHRVNVLKNGKVIIKGCCNQINGLYNIPLVRTAEPSILSSRQQQALGEIQDSKTRQELASYFHAYIFIPTPATLLRSRQERPLQLLAGPHSLPHLQIYRKIHCHKHGPSSSPTEKYQNNKTYRFNDSPHRIS